MDCVFCSIVSGDIPSEKVYEDEEYLAFLDIRPVNPGHTLLIPKKHFSDFLLTPVDVAQGLVSRVQKIAPAVMKGVDADAFNLGLNNGSAAGQIVAHVHMHIIPRQADDGKSGWPQKEYAPGESGKVAEAIRKLL